LSLFASPVLAQGYSEADAQAALSACLAGTDNAAACVGVVKAACGALSPEDGREYIGLSCGEAEFAAWYEAMQRETEQAFRAVEAFEDGLLEGGVNPDYIVIYTYLSEAQQGWEAYVRAQCAIAPQVAALTRANHAYARECEIEKFAARITELRGVAAGLK
jgi:uncharacterized protein YecT (DUF1311 family)